MSSERTEEALAKEAEVVATVRCGGYCDRDVYESATVDVVAGATVGEWDDPEPHVGVTGVDDAGPHVEQWCVTCASDAFGLDESAAANRREAVQRYLTPATATAFVAGALLALAVSAVFVV